MAIKIVTDSTSDISPEVASELGITVVPVYVRFGEEVYRDGVDITNDAFYQKMADSVLPPSSSEPTPEDFAKAYSECSDEADSIISIHVSAKTSDTYNSALQGKNLVKGKCRIEVIDSHFTSVGLALVVMTAARLARAGEKLPSIFEETRKVIDQVQMLGFFETMRYLVLGGRLSKAAASVAGILNVRPLLTFKNGELIRAGLAHKRSDGVDKLYEFAENNYPIQDIAIAYSTVPEQAGELKARLGSLAPEERVYVTQLGAALGVHCGPGALLLALRPGYQLEPARDF
ncbi:DegV family protein [Chloroflexota bacterium]